MPRITKPLTPQGLTAKKIVGNPSTPPRDPAPRPASSRNREAAQKAIGEALARAAVLPVGDPRRAAYCRLVPAILADLWAGGRSRSVEELLEELGA
jgi:hypothetical protein